MINRFEARLAEMRDRIRSAPSKAYENRTLSRAANAFILRSQDRRRIEQRQRSPLTEGRMAEFIAHAGDNLELWRCHIDEIREQDRNARTMAPEMMERLSLTIKREKRLESIPFTVKRDGWFELISGHHRVRGCRAAGVETIIVLADTRDLDRSQIVAKQLAHNAIDAKTIATPY